MKIGVPPHKSLGWLLLALLLFSVLIETVFRPAEASIFHWLRYFPRAVVVNGLLVGALGCFALVLSGRFVFSGVVAGGFITLLSLTHASTLSTLGRPLFPWELLLVRQAVDIWPYATAKFGAVPMALGALLLVAALVASWRTGPRLPWEGRALIALGLVALCGWLVPQPGTSLGALGIAHRHWEQIDNYRQNGLPLAFLMNLPAATVRTPRGYSRERAEELLSGYAATAGTGETPDVVVVMSESFFDFTRLPGLTFENDPLPTLHRLQREAASGTMYPPLFGGGTANTEYEVLTGNAVRWLPAGSVPYQQYVKQPLPALPSQFAARGYRTTAVHIYRRWFWDRDQVYPRLGFDRFVSEEDVAVEGKLFYTADVNLTRAVKKELEAPGEQPLFLFAISVEAHGPYEGNRYPTTSLRVNGPLDAAARSELGTYAEAAGHADHELSELVAFLERRARPTVLIFFGDHLPSLPQTLRQTGVLEAPEKLSSLDMAHRAFLYEVPLVVWSNQHNERRELGAFSTNYLGPLLLRETGAPGTRYTAFLDAARARFPIVTPQLVRDAHGAWHEEETPEFKQLHDDWYLLEYDQLFGERVATH